MVGNKAITDVSNNRSCWRWFDDMMWHLQCEVWEGHAWPMSDSKLFFLSSSSVEIGEIITHEQMEEILTFRSQFRMSQFKNNNFHKIFIRFFFLNRKLFDSSHYTREGNCNRRMSDMWKINLIAAFFINTSIASRNTVSFFFNSIKNILKSVWKYR